MINQLKSYRNGVHGEFFLKVADELERMQKLTDSRLETIKAMSFFLDGVVGALGVAKPETPVEGIGACWKVMEAIQTLQAKVKSLEEDRTWQIKQNVRMFEVIQEVVKYLDTNNLTNIMHGSVLHQKLRDALVIDPIVCESCNKPIVGDVVPYDDANICQQCHTELTTDSNLPN